MEEEEEAGGAGVANGVEGDAGDDDRRLESGALPTRCVSEGLRCGGVLPSSSRIIGARPSSVRLRLRRTSMSLVVERRMTLNRMIRIGVVQFDCILGNVALNKATVRRLLLPSLTDTTSFDVVVLPELALTGYNFSSPRAIAPYLEPTAAGPTTAFMLELSRQHKSATFIAGYPERDTATSATYNSAVVVRNNTVLAHYRKHFMYATDTVWGCTPGPSFHTPPLFTIRNLRCILGICMDLSPFEFTAPYEAREFAHHVHSTAADLAIVPMAWLKSPNTDSSDDEIKTVAYWADRMACTQTRPLIFVAANRCGKEGTAEYAGSSAVLTLQPDATPVAHGILSADHEGLLDVQIPCP